MGDRCHSTHNAISETIVGMDFSHLLAEKTDTILKHWVDAVYADGQIETAKELTHKALRDSLPQVLQALAKMLSQVQESDTQTLVEASLEHGIVRAEQGFDAAEIAREYRLLRWVIFSILEDDLVQAKPQEILRAVRLIDTVVDEAIARCFKSYTEGRLKELEELQRQLRLTNQELTRLVRASRTNMSHLAHELKTPLASIIGYSELFLRQHQQDDEIRDTVPRLENIERVLRSGRQLLHLINDSLEMSRYEAGQMQLHLASTDIPALMTDLVDMVKPLVETKQLTLVLECDRAPKIAVTDPLRLQQVVLNLLSNAIRYTSNGSVQLRCETRAEGTWAIAVTDTGIGIDSDDQTHIFEPYFRGAPPEQAEKMNSTGLGLAIVARLVELLQGQIKVSSQVGTGSTFTVILPLEMTVE